MLSLDHRIACTVQRWAGGPTLFWRFFARYALYVFVVAVVVFAFLMTPQDALFRLLLPSAAAFALSSFLQHLIRRERPTVTKTDFAPWILTFSFPSAHASASFCFAVVLAAAVRDVVPELTFVFIPAVFLIAVGISLSRVVVGVHYPTDVLAGAAFGALVGILFGSVLE